MNILLYVFFLPTVLGSFFSQEDRIEEVDQEARKVSGCAILNGHDNIVERIFELGAPLTDLTKNSIMPPLHFLANKFPYQSTLREVVRIRR